MKIVPLMLIAFVILLSAPIKVVGTKLPSYCCGRLVKPQPCACKYFIKNPVLLPRLLIACRVPHPKC
ncbi:unnamed protein product [Arabidopsis halleri]